MVLVRDLTFLAVLVAASLATWWVSHQSEPQGSTPRPDGQRPDYWVDGLRVVTLSSEGIPERRLVSDAMRHYANDTAELDLPRLEVTAKDGIQWQVRAEHGLVGPNREWVQFQGAVKVQRDAAPGVEPVVLLSETLRFRPKTEYVETDQPVRIETGQSWVEGVGLEAWVSGPLRIKLLSQVRGHYVQQK